MPLPPLTIPPLTLAEAQALPSIRKSSAAAIALYTQYDYLTAYAAHTDLRVQEDGPAAAIGGEWETGGQRQLAFLRAHGVTPQTRVLDIGCGTGRLARLLVPYLAPHHYTGIDIAPHALGALQALAQREGWDRRGFVTYRGVGSLEPVYGQTFDILWAYAVFIHLPPPIIDALLASLQHVTFARLYFSHKGPACVRTGLKQFSAPLTWYQTTARQYGFRVEAAPGVPYLPQPMACLTRQAP